MIISMTENTPLPSVREFVEASVDFRSAVIQKMSDAERIAFEALTEGSQVSSIVQAIQLLSDSIHAEILLLLVGMPVESQVILGTQETYTKIAQMLFTMPDRLSIR
jgi:hypothetical protein